MICPECHTEYVEGIEICADCKVSLVDEVPLKEPLKKINWIALQTIEGRIYADMVAEVLSNENIPHYIKSDWMSSALSITGANLVGSKVKIMVPESDLTAASAIMKDIIGD